MHKLEINFLPKSQNEVINLSRKNKFLANLEKKKDENKVFWEMRKQWIKFPKFEKKIYVLVEFETTFARDSDNLGSCLKPIFDTFQKQGIVKNDNLNHLEYFVKNYTKCKRGEEKIILYISEKKPIISFPE